MLPRGGGGGGDYFGSIPYTEEEKNRIASLLRQNLGDEYISRREGPGGSSVSYIEGWKILDLANDIFGFNGWSNSIIRMEVLICDFLNNRWSIGIDCTIRVTLRDGSYHEDVGWGSGTGRDKGATMEKARKEAVTDGLKRVLKTFGSVMGNCIYQKDYQKRLRSGEVPADSLYKRPRLESRYGDSAKSDGAPKPTVSGTMGAPPPAAPVPMKAHPNTATMPPPAPVNDKAKLDRNVLVTPIQQAHQGHTHSAYPPQQLQHRSPPFAQAHSTVPPLLPHSTILPNTTLLPNTSLQNHARPNGPPANSTPKADGMAMDTSKTVAPRPMTEVRHDTHGNVPPAHANGPPSHIPAHHAGGHPPSGAVHIIKTNGPLAPLNQVNGPRPPIHPPR